MADIPTTAIIPDTNSWKFTAKGYLGHYKDYVFAGEMKEINDFIGKNGLEKYIHILLPTYVYTEQKRQARKDLKHINNILDNLKNNSLIDLNSSYDLETWDNTFEVSFKKFRAQHPYVNLLKFPKNKASKILEDITKRYLEEIPPFNKKTSFFDTLIWEMFLATTDTNRYQNIIFFSKDGGFNECKTDLEKESGRNCDIYNNIDMLLSKLKNIYENSIDLVDIKSYVNGKYFRGKLKEAITQELINSNHRFDDIKLSRNLANSLVQTDENNSDIGEFQFICKAEAKTYLNEKTDYEFEIYIDNKEITEILWRV